MAKSTMFTLIFFMAILLAGTVNAESTTVFSNNKGVVHKGSGGKSVVFPDVCKTPSPGGPIPIPYPNIGKSSDTAKGSKKVKMDGNPIMLKNSNFKTSIGDEPGIAGNSHADTPPIKPKATVNYSRPLRRK
jgi:hypothetical protein